MLDASSKNLPFNTASRIGVIKFCLEHLLLLFQNKHCIDWQRFAFVKTGFPAIFCKSEIICFWGGFYWYTYHMFLYLTADSEGMGR
jgi:hypothetical protein